MHENEILVFILGSVVLAFLLIFYRQLYTLPYRNLLISAFFATWVSWLATNVEHLALPGLFNLIEHLGYFCNGLLLLLWCVLVARQERV